ncbi:uncharacterized protein LOC112190170 [Rosa chinensis]|uniref:uncharacterized protein LOC112190170 n=1 Tax=Rosa chinensis TaxID=74649 RepID=UPI000D093260|nr:uncharacterized protein LOC112190170 [Rosa chinensis]XP_024185360.1 uncharacterized protein LOC112190170 [Rosa chinensis]XP_040370398.1 uncharacterized protein LOC112190170 [Rosa chinensis]
MTFLVLTEIKSENALSASHNKKIKNATTPLLLQFPCMLLQGSSACASMRSGVEPIHTYEFLWSFQSSKGFWSHICSGWATKIDPNGAQIKGGSWFVLFGSTPKRK